MTFVVLSKEGYEPVSILQFLGILTFLRLVQPLKAQMLILLTLSGIVTSLRLEQSLKAEAPIQLTLSGIVTDVRLLQ